MVQDAFKKQYLSSHEVFQAKRWEGKPLGFKLKYLVSNHPELALTSFGFLVLFPAILFIKHLNFNEEKSKALRKYKPHYTGKTDARRLLEMMTPILQISKQKKNVAESIFHNKRRLERNKSKLLSGPLRES